MASKTKQAEKKAKSGPDDATRLGVLPPPREPTRAAIERAMTRHKSRPERLQVAGGVTDGVLRLDPLHSDIQGHSAQIYNAFGTTSLNFIDQGLAQLGAVLRGFKQPQTASDFNFALAVLDGLQPENEVEAMLAMQMVATHNVAMTMLARSKQSEFLEQANTHGSLAVKLLRTYTAQVEALAKLRRKGEQTVRVEHVHVHSGGQAIVGNITGPGGGGGDRGNGGQPHALGTGPDYSPTLALSPGAPVRGPDEERDALPVASGEG